MGWIKRKLAGLYRFCSDAAHRRAIAVVIMLLLAHFGGKELDLENVDQVVTLVIAALGAAWMPKSNG